jgi:hypothetical protein
MVTRRSGRRTIMNWNTPKALVPVARQPHWPGGALLMTSDARIGTVE